MPEAVTPPTGEASLAAAVIGLVRERDRALAAGDRAALERLTVPDSAAAGEDIALLASLEAAGAAVVGLRTVVEDVAVLDLGQNGARVAVVTTQAPHARSVPGQPGAVAVPRQPTRCTVLILSGADERWRVREATACPEEIS
ncbi:MAG TPA: hypothetical protein VN257_05420 [Actinotalea sp.]|nr:hypothetical protein [Actinotalea sp.]